MPDSRLEVGQTATGPLTPEEIADRLVPKDPRLSPDGRDVAFVVATQSKKGEHPEQALWLSRDGKPAEPFTAGSACDDEPRWSPDGSRLLFLSDRAERGTNRIYLIRRDGGEARPLGNLAGDLRSPEWSPDGTRIAVLRKDQESEAEKARKESRDDAIVVDADPRRTRLWVVDVETGTARQLTYGTREVWSFAWSPDGDRFAIITTDEAGVDARFGPCDLWLIPATGGLPKHLAHFPSRADYPIFVETPDGEAVAVRANWHREDPVDSVWVVPTQGGEPRNLLPNLAGNVEELRPLPGARGSVALRIAEGTHVSVYALDLATAELRPLTPAGLHREGAALYGPSLSAGGETIAVVWADGDVPQEVYVGQPGQALTAVTSLGKAFAGRLQPVEHVTWESDGVEIEGLLTLPAGYQPGRRYPLIVEVHGGPTALWKDMCFLDWHDWAQYLASHGFAVLAPNPRGSTGRGAAFQKLLQDDVGGGESRDLIAGARAMVERGIADPERLGIGGWSWGGYLTAITITQTDLFKAAVMGAGLSNLLSDHGQNDIPSANLLYFPGLPYHHPDAYLRASAISSITNCKTPTLILHGDNDARVHPAQGMEMYRALKSLGVPTEFVRYPREGHSIRERAHQIDVMRRVLEWFERWLKA